jgi:hypothetical protein
MSLIDIGDAVTAASKLIEDAIDKVWPNPDAQAQAQASLIKANSDAALAQLQQQMSVMLAEAQSADPWTSRARPSFMYVMYILILCAIPMGVLSVFSPTAATAIGTGLKAWLGAIPDAMWGTFGTAYCGYTLSRSWEKKKGLTK